MSQRLIGWPAVRRRDRTRSRHTRHIDGIAGLVLRLGEIITKAGTVQKSGEFIESAARAIKDDIDARAAHVLRLLQRDAA
ncbi:MAG: hypothetical protein FJ271_30570 [Planctomycetes bacterium]|nr:hypothetical protein [Planctomycetota bacterium]